MNYEPQWLTRKQFSRLRQGFARPVPKAPAGQPRACLAFRTAACKAPRSLAPAQPRGYADGMETLLWIGTAITLVGLAGIVWCGVAAARARAAGLEDAALRARLERLVPINLGALAISAIGLMCVILGVVLI